MSNRTSNRRAPAAIAVTIALTLAGAVTVVAATSSTAGATAPPPSSPPDSSPTPGAGTGPGMPPALPEGYDWVVDDTSSIVVAVPISWSDTDLAPTQVPSLTDGVVPYIAASPDREKFLGGFEAPGVRFVALPFIDGDDATLADQYGINDGACADVTEAAYEDPVFTGTQFIGTDCGESGASWYVIVAAPAEEDFTIVIDVQTLTPEDEEAYATILETFNLTDTALAPGASLPGSSAPSAATEPSVIEPSVIESTEP